MRYWLRLSVKLPVYAAKRAWFRLLCVFGRHHYTLAFEDEAMTVAGFACWVCEDFEPYPMGV